MSSYVNDLYRDEIRDGFLVTTDRKKLWNAQIELVLEFQRICKKHNLKYFASGGTLLGAVRHKGFIPWDDDIDLGMLRPDYEKFKQIAPEEIKPPFYFDPWYDNEMPTVDLTICGWPNRCPFIKIRDERTTMIEAPNRKTSMHQGIWIDIFPYEPVPPFKNQKDLINFVVKREMLAAIMYPDKILEAISQNVRFTLTIESLKNLISMPFREKTLQFEKFCAANFNESTFVTNVALMVFDLNKKFRFEWLEKTIELPFENISIAAPQNYNDFLNTRYGNWHEMIRGGALHNPLHAISADISYKDYFNLAFNDGVSPEIKGRGIIDVADVFESAA